MLFCLFTGVYKCSASVSTSSF